jgi:hypothetical protein
MPGSRATWVTGSSASVSRSALRIWQSVNVGRRPPKPLLVTLR